MPTILEYPLQISLNHGLIVICVPHFYNTYSYLYSIFRKALRNISVVFQSCPIRAKYTLQIFTYSQKHFACSREFLKSNSNIKKSYQKEDKALLKYSTSLLFSMNLGLIHAVSRLNPVL